MAEIPKFVRGLPPVRTWDITPGMFSALAKPCPNLFNPDPEAARVFSVESRWICAEFMWRWLQSERLYTMRLTETDFDARYLRALGIVP